MLISLVTLILIVGSALLSRIVFKAASADATLYFDQSVISVKPEATFNVDVLADLSSAADIVGVQLELNFDPKILKVVATQPAVLWKDVKSRVDEGKLSLVVTPVERGVSTGGAVAGLSLARLTFATLAEGETALTLTSANTILAVSNARGVENIIETVIDAQVRVSPTAPSAPNDSTLKVDAATTLDEPVFSSQRIISTAPILTPDSAVILVRLEHPARITVVFGQTALLGNRAEYSSRTDQAAVRIAGLDSGQRYFYQIVAEDDNAANRILGQVKSFELPALSPDGVVERAELTVFPPRAKSEATAYAVFFDSSNRVIGAGMKSPAEVGVPPTIGGLAPQLQTDSQQVSATKFGEVNGLYQAVLGSLETKKQTVRYTLLLNGQRYATASAIFDPSIESATDASPQPLLGLKLDQSTTNLILALVAGLILLGLGFYKLARAR